MKRLFLILCFLLLGHSYSFAQGKFNISLGPTVSYFLEAKNAKPKVGIVLGINREFHLYKKFSFSAGVSFASRGAMLQNRTIAPYVSEPTDAFYQDIHGMIIYLEFPLLVHYEVPISKRITIMPIIGPALTYAISDLSHFEKKRFFKVRIPGEGLSDYDFWAEQESTFRHNLESVLLINFGIQFQYSRYAIEIRYVMDNRDSYYFDSLAEVHNEMNSLYFLISFNF